jgi:dipeptidyl-peptidase-4
MFKRRISFSICILCCSIVIAQPPKGIHWDKEGKSFYSSESGEIIKYNLPSFTRTVIADENKLTPAGTSAAMKVRNFFFSNDDKKILIYTNSKKVWRYETTKQEVITGYLTLITINFRRLENHFLHHL